MVDFGAATVVGEIAGKIGGSGVNGRKLRGIYRRANDVIKTAKSAVSHDYKAKNGNLLKSTYANGWEVAYTCDNLDRVTEVKASKDGTSYTIGRYIYDKLGRVARFVDGQVSGKSIRNMGIWKWFR